MENYASRSRQLSGKYLAIRDEMGKYIPRGIAFTLTKFSGRMNERAAIGLWTRFPFIYWHRLPSNLPQLDTSEVRFRWWSIVTFAGRWETGDIKTRRTLLQIKGKQRA